MSGTENGSGLIATSSGGAMTVRRIFIASTVCWNLAAIAVGVFETVAGLSQPGSRLAGWLSLAFALAMTLQGYVVFHLLKISFLRRYIRFGFTAAAFARVSPKLMAVWLSTGLAGIGLYAAVVTKLVLLTKSTGDADVQQIARTGVVLYTIVGGLVASLLVGLFVVSRISPYFSSWLVGPTNI